MRPHTALALALALAACATPRERCENAATRDLRTVDGLIAELETTLERGYATRTVRVSRPRYTFCDDDGVRRLCWVHEDRLVTRPVAVDLDEARRTLASLRDKRTELAARTQADLAACAALPDSL